MATITEVERLSVVETKVDAIAKDITAINTKLDNLDSKFAAKWVQTAVAFVAGIIIAGFIGGLVTLVVVQPQTNVPTPQATTTVNTK